MRQDPPLDIVMVASEGGPYAKTGGLGDVVAALPVALGELGHQVTVVMPRYRGTDAGEPVERFPLRLGPSTFDTGIFEHRRTEAVRTLLVDCPELYDREALYGIGNQDYPDNGRRFGLLGLAALEHLRRAGRRPSLVHAHDWQAGLVPVYLRARFGEDPTLGGVPTVLTIHNLAYQGLFDPAVLGEVGLPGELFRTEALEYWGRVSYLKGGVVFANLITTVSRTYAKEILTDELGFGFDGILSARRKDLVGILNGIDTDTWDPERDPFLPEPYSAAHLAGKMTAKRVLLAEVGLPADPDGLERPLVGMVSRMVDQKGFDLLASAADPLLRLDVAFVVLGSGDPAHEAFWRRLAERHAGRLAVRIGFDERLAHLIEAGSDLFLMPSRFEPCGLNQMYSLRYGTVPIVRAVGGLADTVQDVRKGRGTGFRFRSYEVGSLLRAVRSALKAYRDKPLWRAIQLAGMRQDHSWNAAAREYVKVYRKAGRLASARRSAAIMGAARR